MPETYQWLLVPVQKDPAAPVAWETTRLSGHGALAVRAANRLKSDDVLASTFSGTRLQIELERIPLWRGEHVSIPQLIEDFAQYLYLPRLQDPSVLLGAAADGVALLTWEKDTFAYADSFDEDSGRYRGLRSGQVISLADPAAPGLLVRPAAARRQLDAEEEPVAPQPPTNGDPVEPGESPTSPADPSPDPVLKRFFGSVSLDATRAGLDAS